jgi:hypothetical protein
MKRALAAAALAGGLVGYGAGAITPAAADTVQELVLYREWSAVVFCDNWGHGELETVQIDEATIYVHCGGKNFDKDSNGVRDDQEHRRR